MLNPAVSSILESPSVVPSKVEASSTKEASLNVEYGNAIQENFGLKEAVYYKGREIGRRMHRIAAGIWEKFLYDEGVTSEEEKVLYEEDPILLQLQQEEKFARIAEATHTVRCEKNEKFGKISQTEKEDIVAKVRNSRIKDTVREMVRARAQWINLHFDADPGEPQEKRTERYAYANRLTFFQQDEMDKLRQVYDTGQAYFDYETAKLQKTMLEGRLHEFFNATNPQEREHLSLQLSATLNFPSHNLLSIRMKGGSVEDQVAEAMQFNKQDSQLEYLKGLIDPSLIENNSDNV